MKKIIMLAAGALAFAAAAQDKTEILDLSKAATPLQFDADNGAWTETYNDAVTSLNSQCFSLVHGSMGEYLTWWGFTASNSANNSRRDDTMKYQFSNMAEGGIILNADGTLSEVSPEVPYIVGFYNSYMSARPCDIAFTDGKARQAVGVYLNLNSYPYYCIEEGDAFARAFTNGDRFTLTIHGVGANESEKTIDVNLAYFTNGDLTINRGWRYVDLTPLGVVNEIYFTMSSTDTGEWGMNTPGYFCLDKLTVREADASSIAAAAGAGAEIAFDRSRGIATAEGAEFIAVYDAAGRRVGCSEGSEADLSALPAGVYVIKAAGAALKIAK